MRIDFSPKLEFTFSEIDAADVEAIANRLHVAAEHIEAAMAEVTAHLLQRTFPQATLRLVMPGTEKSEPNDDEP